MPADGPLRIFDHGVSATSDPARLLDGGPGYQVRWEVAIMEGHRHVLKPEREAPYDYVRALADVQPGRHLGRGRDAGHLADLLTGPLALLKRLRIEALGAEADGLVAFAGGVQGAGEPAPAVFEASGVFAVGCCHGSKGTRRGCRFLCGLRGGAGRGERGGTGARPARRV